MDVGIAQDLVSSRADEPSYRTRRTAEGGPTRTASQRNANPWGGYTLPATIKERVMRTRDPRSGGAQGMDGR